MGNVINLRQARKARGRTEKEALARENRTRFGRTGAEKRRDADEAERGDRAHESHRIEDTENLGGGKA